MQKSEKSYNFGDKLEKAEYINLNVKKGYYEFWCNGKIFFEKSIIDVAAEGTMNLINESGKLKSTQSLQEDGNEVQPKMTDFPVNKEPMQPSSNILGSQDIEKLTENLPNRISDVGITTQTLNELQQQNQALEAQIRALRNQTDQQKQPITSSKEIAELRPQTLDSMLIPGAFVLALVYCYFRDNRSENFDELSYGSLTPVEYEQFPTETKRSHSAIEKDDIEDEASIRGLQRPKNSQSLFKRHQNTQTDNFKSSLKDSWSPESSKSPITENEHPNPTLPEKQVVNQSFSENQLIVEETKLQPGQLTRIERSENLQNHENSSQIQQTYVRENLESRSNDSNLLNNPNQQEATLQDQQNGQVEQQDFFLDQEKKDEPSGGT